MLNLGVGTRKILFLLTTIIRLLLAGFVYFLIKSELRRQTCFFVLRMVGVFVLLLGFMEFTLFFTNRKKAFFGGPVWYRWYRPIHGILYFMFAYFALPLSPDAAKFRLFIPIMILLGDVALRVLFFMFHYKYITPKLRLNIKKIKSDL
tara:strand:- start:228 stop:671 length:444 start_codon:yes stop_codon:yes gene_type:complete